MKENPIEFINFGYMVRMYVQSELTPIREKYDLKKSELSLLVMLAVYPAANTSKKICELGDLKRGNVSILVESLCERELIYQETDKLDRRVKYLHLTDKASEIVENSKIVLDNCRDTILQGISEEELEVCNKTFQKMLENTSKVSKVDIDKE